MDENTGRIGDLLAEERDIRRRTHYRLLARFADRPGFLWASLGMLALGGLGIMSLSRIEAGDLTLWIPALSMLAMVVGLAGLNTWLELRRVRKIEAALGSFPAPEVDNARQLFTSGKMFAPRDLWGLAAALLFAALLWKVALDLLAAGKPVSAGLAALMGLAALVAHRWRVR